MYEVLKRTNTLYKHLNKKREALVQEEVTRELESRTDTNSENYQELNRVKKELEKTNCHLCLPLFTQKGLIGILNIGAKVSNNLFTGEDIDLLTTLAQQLATSLENALLQEEQLKIQKQLLLADKLTAVGTMMAGMVHEIKNPIASIQSLTQTLSENKDDPELFKDYLDMVPAQMSRIKKITENILNYSKMPKLKIITINVNNIIEEVCDLFNHACRKKGIKLIKDLAPLPAIQADPDQLSQVFMNFVLNATEAMPTGGSIWIKTKVKGNEIQIEFRDSGLGISEKRLKNIFDPFFTMKHEGTGLGLWISHQIIKRHQGSIEVESKINKGTTFYLSFPVQYISP